MEIFIIVFCIALNALLAGAETAFIAVNKSIVREMVKRGKKGAHTLLYLRENPEKTLSVIQIGITFVGAFAAAVGGAGAEEVFAPWLKNTFSLGERTSELIAITLVVLAITYVSVILGELVPKTLGLRRPVYFAMKVAPWLYVMSRLAHPIVTLLEKSTKGVIWLFPKKHTAAEILTEETESKLETFSVPAQNYVLNIAKLERTISKDLLVRWADVITVDFTHSVDEVEKVVIASGHTRLPVVRDDVVVGILNSKEFMAFQKTNQPDWTTIIRSAIEVQETTPVLTSLRLMQDKHVHMVIVNRGQTQVGILTMEEILEDIVGDIFDENDDGAIQRILSRKMR